MATPVLATKLYVPAPRSEVVSRTRLLERLSEGRTAGRRLSLLCAPAGFGKSTLLSEWAARSATSMPSWRVGWLSLDDGDNDPSRFLTHVIAALHGVDPTVGGDAKALLERSPLQQAEPVLVALLNDLARSSTWTVLVLDDYHVIDARPVHDALTFLLDHLPHHVHVAVASRSDPPLPLARLRGRNDLTELRAAELRFRPDEARHFLNRVMGLDLSTDDVAALEARTEGWIVGLQLAALSMRDREDVSGFIRTFAGSNRFVLDYLVDEVLLHQMDRVRTFLMHTAVLDRLTGPLCDAITGQGGGGDMLEFLERANMFVVPLDDRRQWYRYHHLFADVLRSRLAKEEPDQVPSLHQRASTWYEAHGLHENAVRHALAAKDFERAASVMETAMPIIRRQRQDGMLLGWLTDLPEHVIYNSPVLSTFYAWMMLLAGDLEAAERRLQDAEAGLGAATHPVGTPEDVAAGAAGHGEEFRKLPMTIAIYRASLAQALGDIAGTAAHARRALLLSGPDDHLARGGAAGFLGLAAWANGEVDTALSTFSEAVSSLHAAGNVADELGSTIVLADMWIAKGRLSEARRLYERSLKVADAEGEPVPPATADLHVGICELRCESGETDIAMQHLETAKTLAETASLSENRYRWFVAMARVTHATGDPDAALRMLEEAERRYRRGFFPEVRPIPAMSARILIGQGRLREASDWAREHGVSVTEQLSYLREYEHLTLARLLLAQHGVHPGEVGIAGVTGLLDRLREAAEATGRGGSLNEILMLQALARNALREPQLALAALEQVLVATQHEGYLRLFLDEGAPMTSLLHEAAREGIAPEFVTRLLRASRPDDGAPLTAHPTTGQSSDALSERELQVLRLLNSPLSGPEMARELFVSLNTLRSHTKHIFEKLDVSSRAAAVHRAHERGLI